MENFNQIFTLLANKEGISLNVDILETGVINITIVIVILVTLGRDFLGSILEKRENEIARSLQDAEERLNEANTRLADAEKQLTQAYLIINEIKNETISSKKVLLQSDAYQSKKDLAIRFSRALATFQNKEREIFSEIKQQIVILVLKRTIIRAQETFGKKKRAADLITETINRLEGKLL
jgi:F0F1-type ATP synthase membrane subunit b/b'